MSGSQVGVYIEVLVVVGGGDGWEGVNGRNWPWELVSDEMDLGFEFVYRSRFIGEMMVAFLSAVFMFFFCFLGGGIWKGKF